MQNIAIVCGGYSGEYDISVKTANVVLKHLKNSPYNAYLIEITKGAWNLKLQDGNSHHIDKNDFTATVEGQKLHFDAVFNAIHGDPGENGKLLGYFDMLGIPYTSCGALESALTFNKYFCNQVVRQTGVHVAPSIILYKGANYELQQISNTLKFPIFVKPNNGGSSVGMSKVNKIEDLEPAIQKAFAESQEVLLEAFVQGRELTMGVFEQRGKLIPIAITEIISKHDFFDYEAKYNDELNQEIVPAPICEEWAEEIRQTSLRLYKALHLKGVVRFDYIYSEKGLFFLEVNTVPGMSEQSLVPKQYNYAYGELKNLFITMIEECLPLLSNN